ncbi:MAG: polysaccharide biosynthesis tyrosine autokinase [Acidobacteriota bacterium]|nr:polysaccharide biosynthesis tyrosine autokinase [Acidobacteriota bacterium]
MAEERNGLEKKLTTEETAIMRPFATPRVGGSYGYGYGYGNESPNGIHLREILRTIRKRKWLVAVIVAIATTLITVEIFRTPSVYRSTGSIEVQRDSPMIVKAKDQVVQFEDSDSLNTKKVIFLSRPLLEDVVILLQLDQNPKFTESLRKKSILDAVREISGRVSSQVGGDDRHQEDANIVSQSINMQERTAEESKRLAPYVNVLRNKFKVESMAQTNIMEISFEHTDKELTAAIVNTAINNFINRSWNRRTEKFTDTSGWLERSTRELKTKVQQAESALADYTARNEIFSTDGKQSLTAEKLSGLSVQVMKAETERMLKGSLYDEVKRGKVNQVPEAFSDLKTSTLKQKLGELQVEQSQLSIRYGPENPKVAEVEEKIKVLQSQIADNQRSFEEKLKTDYERSVREEAELKRSLDIAKSETVQQNQASIRFATLQAELDTARGLYTEFLNKTKQADLQLVEQHNNLKVVETAEIPNVPIGPQRLRTILVGFLVSLLAAIGLAFFLEYLDNTVKSVEDIERIAQLPTLAVIPAISTVAPRVMAEKKKADPAQALSVSPNEGRALTGGFAAAGAQGKLTKLVTLDQLSSVVEAYRMLRTSVLLSAAGNPPKTILFTSGQPGEGKTTTAINTAISLSQLGSSVLLIDADLRRPTVHRVFKMGQSQGLSTFLSRQVEIDPLINKLWVPNLSVLPCGPIPPNPAELISSERMRLLLKELGERYDHILIDSPPLINVTDPVILSTMVDGVILVVQAGRSTRDIVRRARQELGSVGAKIFGVVLNNLDIKREGYDSYLSTYGSYGYGEKQAARR